MSTDKPNYTENQLIAINATRADTILDSLRRLMDSVKLLQAGTNALGTGGVDADALANRLHFAIVSTELVHAALMVRLDVDDSPNEKAGA